MTRRTGRYEKRTVGGDTVSVFIPAPLPPRRPRLAVEPLEPLLQASERALARLELASELVPSIEWFIYGFVRKEAIVSSQIEGTQATLVDLLRLEAGAATDAPADDVREACNYVEALIHARDELGRPDGLPLSLRLLHDAHARLMSGARGENKAPGEVRRSQNWVGGTRPSSALFVPPPPEEVPRLLGELETYLHAEDDLHPLVRTALAHVQFETIHPYLDGNGRVGRLLVTLLLEHWRLCSSPLLYLSVYLKENRARYYELLDLVRTEGDWEAWITFFLEGVEATAEEAVSTARELFEIVTSDRARLLAAKPATVMALRLLEALPMQPFITIPGVVHLLETTAPTAAKAVAALESLGILSETSGRRRDRVYAYTAYLERLRAGTELP